MLYLSCYIGVFFYREIQLPSKCAVMFFRRGRKEFEKSAKLMSTVDDANVVGMVGVCRQMEPLCILMEYLPCGDLYQFLLHRVFDDGANQNRHGPPALRSAVPVTLCYRHRPTLSFVVLYT